MSEFLMNPSNEIVSVFLILASIRIYLEIIDFNFSKLPITKSLAHKNGKESLEKFHRSGFYLSIGYVVFFAPQVLLT